MANDVFYVGGLGSLDCTEGVVSLIRVLCSGESAKKLPRDSTRRTGSA